MTETPTTPTEQTIAEQEEAALASLGEPEPQPGYKNPLLHGMQRVSAYQTTDGVTHPSRKDAIVAQARINFSGMIRDAIDSMETADDLVAWIIANQEEVRGFLNFVREV